MVETFSVQNAFNRIVDTRLALNQFAHDDLSVVEALNDSRVIAHWVFGQVKQAPDLVLEIVKNEAVTPENIARLNGLWAFCAKNGIILDNAQKISLFIRFHKVGGRPGRKLTPSPKSPA